MDISTNIGSYDFNFRVGALIIHNGKLLCHKADADSYYAIPGGRVKNGEDTESAIIREMKEELGKGIHVQRLSGVIENFFYLRDRKLHELLFVFECEFWERKDQLITETLSCIKPGKNLKYEWVDIANIDKVDIRPAVLKELLKRDAFGSGPAHIINNEY